MRFTQPDRGRAAVPSLHLVLKRYEHRKEEGGRKGAGCDITDGTPKNHRSMSYGGKPLSDRVEKWGLVS